MGMSRVSRECICKIKMRQNLHKYWHFWMIQDFWKQQENLGRSPRWERAQSFHLILASGIWVVYSPNAFILRSKNSNLEHNGALLPSTTNFQSSRRPDSSPDQSSSSGGKSWLQWQPDEARQLQTSVSVCVLSWVCATPAHSSRNLKTSKGNYLHAFEMCVLPFKDSTCVGGWVSVFVWDMCV